MDVLYKYFSEKLPAEYFINPTIKLTTTQNLNDPFESSVVSDIKKLYKTHELQKRNVELSNFTKNLLAETNIEFILQRTGIVSLTETHRNKLMWAHYASEHKGLVIGYKSDMLGDITIENLPNEYYCSLQPIKIMYDSLRFDYLNQLDDTNMERDIIKNMLTTKSDDWIYEKEHRYIIPIRYCDKIDYNKENSAYILSLMHKENQLEYCPKDDNYKFNLKSDLIIPALNICAVQDDFSFYMKISKQKVHSIYLGCRYSEDKKDKLLEILTKNKNNLGHIKLYQYKLSKDRFDLITDEIKWNC